MDQNLLRDIRPADILSLGEHEERIRDFVETHLLDECGLAYSFLNARTLKPWTNEELREYNLMPVCHPHVTNPADYYAYENSLMATGEYALSQVLRYEVTGDGRALAAAAHPVYALLRVLHQGELFEKGYLPKPFGGVRKCCYSHEISPDQYIKACVALRAYQKYAPPAVSRVIDDYLVAIADYHLARGFIHPRRESFVVTPENRPHSISILVPILVIAGKITGDPKYVQALSRFDAILDDYAAGKAQVHFNLCSLMVEGFHLAMQEGLEDDRLRRSIGKLWEMHLDLIQDDGLGRLGPESTVKSAEVVRMPSMAPIVEQYFPEMEALKVGVFVLSRVNEPARMLYVNDWGGEPQRYHGPLADSICELAVASWLVGYWRTRQVV